MKTAAAGQIEVLAPAPPASAELGVRVVIPATSRGPRQPAVVSETVVDGIIAAFHVGLGPGPAAAAVAAAMAPRLPGMAETDMQALAAGSTPGPLFSPSAFTVKGTHIQISPCDERCQAGEVTIRPDAKDSTRRSAARSSFSARYQHKERNVSTSPRRNRRYARLF